MPDEDLTIAVLQPGYLPWLGFFDQLRRSDVFVYYDDVQYDTHGWRNRNRIKAQHGPQWLTVPVRHGGLDRPSIRDVKIDGRSAWARKHVASVRQAYTRAPFLARYLAEFEARLTQPWERLVDLNYAVVDLLAGWLGLVRRIERSSELGITGGRSERLVRICERFGATTYLSGQAAKDYLDVELFRRRGITVQFQDFAHPVYPQMHGAFVPALSALDLILNCGPESAAVLSGLARQAADPKVEQRQ